MNARSRSPAPVRYRATDGLTDAVNTKGEIFELERLMEIIKDNASSPARELEDTVFKAVMEFSRGAEQADDIAVLVVEFH